MPAFSVLPPGERTNSPGCETWAFHVATCLVPGFYVYNPQEKARIRRVTGQGHATSLTDLKVLPPRLSTNSPGYRPGTCQLTACLFCITSRRKHEFAGLQDRDMPIHCLPFLYYLQEKARIRQVVKHGHVTSLPAFCLAFMYITPRRKHEFAGLQARGMPLR